MRPIALVLLVTALCAPGCASQARLTADAIDCRVGKVKIVPSIYQRQGMETAWCAMCGEKVYQCATNADRTKTECRESREGDGCL